MKDFLDVKVDYGRPRNTLLITNLAHNDRSPLHQCFQPLTYPSKQAILLVTPPSRCGTPDGVTTP
jgi:hypothetical protein